MLLSYCSCSNCAHCKASRPTYCTEFNLENYVGRKWAGMVCKDSDKAAWARFFGQSSFAEYTLAAETSVVNVSGLLQNDEELNLFAPLGCGFQTGMWRMLGRMMWLWLWGWALLGWRLLW